MKKSFLFALVLLLLASCRYKDLCYDHNHGTQNNLSLELNLKLDLDIDLEVSEEAHTKITVPTYMKVCFYDPLSGVLQKTDFVGPYGGPLHVNPGSYRMVVYSFDTEWTWIRGEHEIDSLEAYTSDITAQMSPKFLAFSTNKEDAPGPIIYTPDHLLVTQKDVEIPPYTLETQVITITASAATVVETYGFEVTNVTGLEYIASAEAFVTNQARSTFFGRGEKNTEPATVYFPVQVSLKENKLKTTFNTFGKLPGDSQSYLHIVITDTEGKVYTITEDITEQFEDPGHEIVIDEAIDIPKPETVGGGIAPTVEDWEDIITDVPIG